MTSPRYASSVDTAFLMQANESISALHTDTMESDVETELYPSVARRVAIAVFLKISRLLGIDLNTMLRNIYSQKHNQSDTPISTPPAYAWDRQLLDWGQVAYKNISLKNDQGFVLGVPALSVVQTSGIAFLDALVHCKSKNQFPNNPLLFRANRVAKSWLLRYFNAWGSFNLCHAGLSNTHWWARFAATVHAFNRMYPTYVLIQFSIIINHFRRSLRIEREPPRWVVKWCEN